MYFGMIILNQSINTTLSYAIWIQIILFFRLKPKIFTKILQIMLKNGLIHQTITKMIKDHFQEV